MTTRKNSDKFFTKVRISFTITATVEVTVIYWQNQDGKASQTG